MFVEETRLPLLESAIEKGLSLSAIGSIFNFSRERARQILHEYNLHEAWRSHRTTIITNSKKVGARQKLRRTRRGRQLDKIFDYLQSRGYAISYGPTIKECSINQVAISFNIISRARNGYWRIRPSKNERTVQLVLLDTGCIVMLPPTIGNKNKKIWYLNEELAKQDHLITVDGMRRIFEKLDIADKATKILRLRQEAERRNI